MCSKASDSKLTNWERKATILDPGGGGVGGGIIVKLDFTIMVIGEFFLIHEASNFLGG